MTRTSLKNLSEEELELVLNNCFANIFVTDGVGNIVFANKDAAEALCVPEEYLLTRTVYDLLEEGITDYSSTENTIRTRARTLASYTNKEGAEIMVVTTPVFDSEGELQLCVTYSRKKTDMDMFVEEIEKERIRSNRYRDAVNYFDESNKSTNVIIYKSKLMEALCRTAQIVAPTDSTVMLYGESGVGKEVFANYIHRHSKRKDEIFIPVNCAAIPANLIETEFFGYEKGAFTGANNKGRTGLFEVVNNGTIFLDEIGELPLDMQSKLLRVLENGEFRRIGSEKIIKTNVRVIGATNRNLQNMVKDKTFREDLYYRLNVLPMDIPALRERPEDVTELASYYLARSNKKYGKRMTLSEEQIRRLTVYSWPGNVRELRNIIERYVVTGNPFVIEGLSYDGTRVSPKVDVPMSTTEEVIMPLKEKMSSAELAYIHLALEACDGNVQKAAEKLGVHKSLIYRKLREEAAE